MKPLELTELEKNIIEQCNKLAKPHNFTIGKFKIKQKVKYCITRDGYDILGNEDIIKVHEFCQNEKDLALLDATATTMVKDYKEKEAKEAASV